MPERSPVHAILLDRDGVLNRQVPGGYLTDVAGWRWLPGALDACRGLAASGAPVAVVTNQSAVARGMLTSDDLRRIHDRMLADIAPFAGRPWPVFHCPHHPDDGCTCRKPAIGMIRQALASLRVPPDAAVLIGDHLTDLQAAARAGCRSVHVRSGRTPESITMDGCIASVPDLSAALRTLRVELVRQPG